MCLQVLQVQRMCLGLSPGRQHFWGCSANLVTGNALTWIASGLNLCLCVLDLSHISSVSFCLRICTIW